MATVLKDALFDYLNSAMLRRWEWGEYDCLIFLADWVQVKTGRDPAGAYRGAYHDQRSARRLMKDAGGIVNLVDTCVEPLGYIQVGEPLRGDIGLVSAPYKQWRNRIIKVPMGAIYIGSKMWVVKPSDPRTMIARAFQPTVIWSCG